MTIYAAKFLLATGILWGISWMRDCIRQQTWQKRWLDISGFCLLGTVYYGFTRDQNTLITIEALVVATAIFEAQKGWRRYRHRRRTAKLIERLSCVTQPDPADILKPGESLCDCCKYRSSHPSLFPCAVHPGAIHPGESMTACFDWEPMEV